MVEGFRNGSLLVVKAGEEPRASSAAQYDKWVAAQDFYTIPFEAVSRAALCPAWTCCLGMAAVHVDSAGDACHRHAAAARPGSLGLHNRVAAWPACPASPAELRAVLHCQPHPATLV